MVATETNPSETCARLINFIKKSKLNFSLLESPFAVSISVKKSFIKDRTGTTKFPLINDLPHHNTPQTIVKSETESLIYLKMIS